MAIGLGTGLLIGAGTALASSGIGAGISASLWAGSLSYPKGKYNNPIPYKWKGLLLFLDCY